MSPFVALWLRAFLVTLAVELAVATPLLRGPRVQRLALVALANLASHPLVWFVFPDLGVGYVTWLVLAEVWAVLVEGFAYRTLSPTSTARALLVAAVANAASIAVGQLLRVAGAF